MDSQLICLSETECLAHRRTDFFPLALFWPIRWSVVPFVMSQRAALPRFDIGFLNVLLQALLSKALLQAACAKTHGGLEFRKPSEQDHVPFL